MNHRLKLALSIVLTGAIVWALWSMADLDALRRGLAEADPAWFAAYLALMIPQLVIAAYRWRYMVRSFAGRELGLGPAFAQLVGANAANLLVPSKVGEFVKGVWLDTGERRFLGFFLVALEKIFDVLATVAIMTACLAVVVVHPLYQPASVLGPVLAGLLACWAAGLWLLYRSTIPVRLVNRVFIKGDWRELDGKWRQIRGQGGPLAGTAALSLVLWSVQLLQFWCMFRVFGISVPLDELGAGSTMALFAGVLPVTVAGVGLRDGALLWYFGTVLSVEVVLSVGLLSLLRILLTGLLGVPFFFVLMRGGRHAT